MKPSQVSAELRRIAAGIDRCSTPVRKDLVGRDVRSVLSAMEQTNIKATVFDPEADGWSDVLTVGIPAGEYGDQMVDAIKALAEKYDIPLGGIESAEAVSDLSAFSPWTFEPGEEGSTGNEQDGLSGPGTAVEIREGGKLVVVLLQGLSA